MKLNIRTQQLINKELWDYEIEVQTKTIPAHSLIEANEKEFRELIYQFIVEKTSGKRD